MLSMEIPPSIGALPPEIEARLSRVGDFFIDAHFTVGEVGPQIVRIGEMVYYRFMDFIYLPQPPESLSTEQIIEICDLRLEYMDHLVVSTLNERIVAEAVSRAKANCDFSTSPVQALDFGCGSGLSSLLLQKYWSKLSIIGVDISKKAVACSHEQHLDARLIEPDRCLPFANASFDVIFAIFVMHFNVGVATLAELRRVLRPSGAFVFNVYQRDIDGVVAQLQDAGFDSIEPKRLAGAGKTHMLVTCKPLASPWLE